LARAKLVEQGSLVHDAADGEMSQQQSKQRLSHAHCFEEAQGPLRQPLMGCVLRLAIGRQTCLNNRSSTSLPRQ